MIRWKFVAFRLLVVVAFLLLVRYTAAPIAHYMIVRSLEASVGAKVEIASTEVGLFPPRINVTGLAIADPRKEMRNAVEVETVLLQIDGSALLRRRYEVSTAKLSGIRIGGHRTTSGRLEVVEPEVTEEDQGPSMISQLFDQYTGDLEASAKDFRDNLATVNEAKRLRGYWSQEYDSLRNLSKQIETDIRTIRDSAKSIDNPLRDLPALQETLQKAEQVKVQLVSMRQRLDALPSRIRGDMASLQNAKRIDQQKVAEMLPIDLSDSGANLGPELLGELVRSQVQQVREYFESGKSIAEVTVASPNFDRARGQTIELGNHKGPNWLVRQCQVDGYLSVDSDEYKLKGVIENITTDKVAQEGPLHARLRLEGPQVVRIDFQRFYATKEGTNAPPRDHLKIHWPELDLPAKKVGSSKQVALSVDGGKLQMWVELDVQGENVTGRLVSQQTKTHVDLIAKPELERHVIVQSLRRSLADIHTVDVDARFVGTWRKLDMDISTNLTNQLSQGVRQAAYETVAAARTRLAEEVEQQYQRQLQELEQWLSTQQGEARQLLAQADEVVEKFSKQAVAQLGSPDAYLGKLRSSFNRK